MALVGVHAAANHHDGTFNKISIKARHPWNLPRCLVFRLFYGRRRNLWRRGRSFRRSGWGFRRDNSSKLSGRRWHLRCCPRRRHARRRGHFGRFVATLRTLLVRYQILRAAFRTCCFGNEPTVWADRQRLFHRFTLWAGNVAWLQFSATFHTSSCHWFINLAAFVASIQRCACRSEAHRLLSDIHLLRHRGEVTSPLPCALHLATGLDPA